MVGNLLKSRKILSLLESYLASGKSQGRYTEIYENPTITDFQDLEKSAKKQKRLLGNIRFIADAKNHKFYVADAYSCVHRDMLKILNLPLNFLTEAHPYVKYGEAVLRGNKLYGKSWLSSSFRTSQDFDWNWIDKYLFWS